MDGVTRREAIIKQLQAAEKPISASKLAGELGVSRQIIVGDIALLRAAGEAIVATARGYRLEAASETGHVSKLCCATPSGTNRRRIVDICLLRNRSD